MAKMPHHLRKFAYKSKADAHKSAKRYHACLDCRQSQREIWKVCPNCGSKNRQYFMSQTELRRGMVLLIQRDAGHIHRLRFQPRYDLVVNGRKVGVYTADAEYFEGNVMIVEDSKPASAGKAADTMDKYALLKIALFEAIHGMTVRIPQRKSGNRHRECLELPLIQQKEKPDDTSRT